MATPARIDDVAARADRWTVAIAVVGTVLAFWLPSYDRVAIPKLTVALLAGAAVAIIGLWRVLQLGSVRRPLRSHVHVAVVGFIVIAGVSVITSESFARSMLGQRGRASGFLLYAAATLVFVAAARSFDDRTIVKLLGAIAAAGAVVGGYGLAQWLGADPIGWGDVFADDAVFATLGNPNFAAGHLGAMLPAATALALLQRRRWELAAAAAAVMGVAVLLTRSAQGPIAAAIGLAVVLLVWALDRAPAARRRIAGAFTAVGLLGAALVLAGLLGRGPLEGLSDVGYEFRRHYWAASVDMVAEEPATGVGFDMWAGHYRAFRSAEAANLGSLGDVTDEPHSVPLGMFASGGVPLGLAYLAFVVLTAVALVRGLRRSSGDARLALAALGGAWLASMVQSAVSVELPSSAVLNFALAGAIVAVATGRRGDDIVVPWLTDARGRRPGARGGRRRTRLAPVAAPVAVVLGLVALWQLTRPLRADVALRDGIEAVNAADPLAFRQVHGATGLLRWEPEYWSVLGDVFASAQQARLALPTYERAIDLDPRRFGDTLNAARVAKAANDVSAATRYYERALDLEPHAIDLAIEFADFLRASGRAEDALAILEDEVPERPTVQNWLHLGDALRAVDRDDDALDAYDRARALLTSEELPLRVELGERYRDLGRLSVARELLEAVLEVAPHSVGASYQLALVAHAEGRTDEAVRLLEYVVGESGPDEHRDARELLAELRGA